jgi:hypothetical protein
VQDNKRHELFYAMRMSLDIARKVVALRISAFSTNEGRDDMICRSKGAGGNKEKSRRGRPTTEQQQAKRGLGEATAEE